MTREQWKERLPLIQAFVDGKDIERGGKGSWFQGGADLSFDGPVEFYRIAPEPKWRGWNWNEVPVGCAVRRSGHPGWSLVLGADKEGIVIESTRVDYEYLLQSGSEYTIDGGKTFQPCGILEGSES